MSKQHSSR